MPWEIVSRGRVHELEFEEGDQTHKFVASSDEPCVIEPPTKLLSVTPFTYETFEREVAIEYPNGTVDSILVCVETRNGWEQVAHFAAEWTSKNTNRRCGGYYAFRNRQPKWFIGTCGSLKAESKRWPRNRPAVIDDALKPYLKELACEKPSIASDINECVWHLEKPGRRYGCPYHRKAANIAEDLFENRTFDLYASGRVLSRTG
jgi:hypothetical protein